MPLLADVPLLGSLFRFDAVGTRRTELLIVLTPHVVRNRFEAEMLKQVESARMDWCLSDVIEMHGPVGLRSRRDPAGATEAETIFPEQVSPQELVPTPERYEPTDATPPTESLPTLPISSTQPSPPIDQLAAKESKFRLPRLFGKSEEKPVTK